MRRPKSGAREESGRRHVPISGVMESPAERRTSSSAFLRKTNVVRAATTFLGRAALLEALHRHVTSSAPLVTLIGPAGAGKTRLALRYVELHGEEWTTEGSGGAWFVDLTEAHDLEGVCGALAGVLDVALVGARTATESVHQIGHALAGRGRTLVVFDDCEAIVEPVAAAISAWLTIAPEVQFVATSRERLGVLGEQRLEVGPLELPAEGESRADVEAVQLFVARAQLVRPGYSPAASEMADIAELTRRLDGLPLAIELAAARMSVLDVRTLLSRMHKRFELLADREGPLRQRTLRDALDASWELLSPWEQEALAQCSVFRGGFGLDAADAIVALDAHPNAPPHLDVLQALREKSLLRVMESADAPGETRLGLYESIRDYATEKLGDGDAARAARARHARHYLDVATKWAAGVTTHGGAENMRKLRLEAENLVVAHARALASEHTDDACRAILALEPVFAARGPYSTYVSLLDATLASAETHRCAPALHARVMLARGQARQVQGLLGESRVDLERSLCIALESDDRRVVARVMLRLSTLALYEGRIAHARSGLEGALHVAREVDDRESEGMLLGFLGTIAREDGRAAEARAYLEQALGILRDVGYRRYEGIHLGNLAGVLAQEGNVDEALRTYQKAIGALRDVGDERMMALTRGNLGCLLQELGRHDAAREEYEKALATHRRVGDRRSVGAMLGFLAGLDHERGAWTEARARYRDALEVLEHVGDQLNRARMLTGHAAVLAASGDVEAAEQAFARAEHDARRIGIDSLLDVVGVHRAHLDLAAAKRASRDGDEATAQRRREQARARMHAAAGRPANDDLRFALRLLRRVLDGDEPHATAAPHDALVVEANGAWFRAPGGEIVDLRLRRAARSLLVTLVRARVDTPGRALSMEDLLRGGWPGERLIPHAGASRVYTMLTTLRNLGLRGLILSRREGHLLDPAVPIVVEELPKRS